MRLRVLHCIYDDPGNPWVAGGGAVRVRELYRRLTDRVDATVATGNYPDASDGILAGVRYRRVGVRQPYALSRLTYGRHATALLRRGDYDAAVFDFSVYTPLRLPRNRPVGATVHHLTTPTARERWGPIVGRLVERRERQMIRQTRWFTATSGATLRLLRELAPDGAEIRLIEAGVPDELFELPRAEGDYVLYFGRLDWFQKGLDVLLDAFARLAALAPEVRLKIAGRGKDLERVRRRIEELRIGDRIDVLGAVSAETQRELLSAARVLLMPSRFEGFGMVAAEAMAAGVPVVAAAAGSLPEVVSPPDGGVLVPPGDAEALAHAVSDLLKDDARRTALGVSARRSAERYRWDRIARLHLDFLHDLHRGASGTALSHR